MYTCCTLTLDLHSELGTLHANTVPGLAAVQGKVVCGTEDKMCNIPSDASADQHLFILEQGQLRSRVTPASMRVRADQADVLTSPADRMMQLVTVMPIDGQLRLSGRT